MREIMFRGKRVGNGEWVYGYPIIVSYKAWIKDINDTTTNPRRLAQDFADFRCVEVEKETVGQDTGLKDRRGVKIYEGDIVAFLGIRWDGSDGDRVEYVGIVRYSDEYTSFSFEISNGLQATTFDADDVKVIGNIHDNPELIGVKNE